MKNKIKFICVCNLLVVVMLCSIIFNIARYFTFTNFINDVYNNNIEKASTTYGHAINDSDNTSGVSTYNSNDDTTYLKTYFSNLSSNFGSNLFGSCGYVGIGMLLSFYDSYLNDNIIPEKFDKAAVGTTKYFNRLESPGTYNDILTAQEVERVKPESKNPDVDEYMQIMVQKGLDKKTPSLHSYLLIMGNDNGYVNLSSGNPFGLTFQAIETLLKYFLNNEAKMREKYDYNIGYYYGNNQAVEETTKHLIDLGYPVLLGVENDKEQHVCIAYDYDDSGIYANLGYFGYDTHFRISDRYDRYSQLMVLDFNIPHSHSNNYQMQTDGNTKSYCYCSHDIITYKQTSHVYNERYELIDENCHYAYCICDEYIIENHSGKNYSKIDETQHYEFCACGNCKIENHSYKHHYDRVDTDYHYSYCGCGVYKKEAHLWQYYTPSIMSLNNTIDDNEDAVNATVIGTRVQCYYCHYVRTLKEGEQIWIPSIP